MIDLLKATTEFMSRGGQMDAPPAFGSRKSPLRTLRRTLLRSEFQEYLDAEGDNDLVETVDGLLDIIVVAWGSLIAYVGEEKAEACAQEVLLSNLAKVTGDGLPKFRDDGKIMKPVGWTPPDIKGVLNA